MDWFYLFAVQGTLKSLVLHHSLKALILCYSAFFMVQLSHPLTISGKTIALTIQTFAGKVKSLIFSILSGFSWLFFQGATIFFFPTPAVTTVTLEPRKVCHCFHCFSRYLPWFDGAGCDDLRFLICTYHIKIIRKKKKWKKAKCLPEEALQIT